MGQGRYFAKDIDGNLRLFGKSEKEKQGALTFLINAKKLRLASEEKPLLPQAPKEEPTNCFDCFKFWSNHENDSSQSDDDNAYYTQRAAR